MPNHMTKLMLHRAWDGCGIEWIMANGQNAADWQPEHLLDVNGCGDMRALTGQAAHNDGESSQNICTHDTTQRLSNHTTQPFPGGMSS